LSFNWLKDYGRTVTQTADAGPTRERILQAAVAEFGAKGYSGARTASIAARARVNPQLISYYFGGKQGLLDELRRRWAEKEANLNPEGSGWRESVAAYLDATLDDPDWARLVVWQALGDGPESLSDRVAQQRARLAPAVRRVRRRQRAGEMTPTVAPEFVLLLEHALAFAPVAMPQLVAGLGQDPCSPAYRRWCVRNLMALLGAKDE
jgi:AcrR family transcriptional regulator